MTHAHDDDAAAQLLDLEGEVLRSYWDEAMLWIRESASDVHRILDLGAGTGTGTIALVQCFGDADVIALDASEEMLRHVRAKSLALGVAPRVHTVRADLDDGWPALDAIDLTWASMSLHHVTDPDRVLRDVLAATRPGGVIAVAELAQSLCFLPDGFGNGLEARCEDAFRAEHADTLPYLGSAWAPRIAAAGFTVFAERSFRIELTPPHPPAVAALAHASLDEARHGLAHRLPRADLDLLAVLLDGTGPDSLRGRADLQVRGSRTVTLAARD